ncbi:hypothetical protein Tcan_01155, partial [Toxocara canis]
MQTNTTCKQLNSERFKEGELREETYGDYQLRDDADIQSSINLHTFFQHHRSSHIYMVEHMNSLTTNPTEQRLKHKFGKHQFLKAIKSNRSKNSILINSAINF